MENFEPNFSLSRTFTVVKSYQHQVEYFPLQAHNPIPTDAFIILLCHMTSFQINNWMLEKKDQGYSHFVQDCQTMRTYFTPLSGYISTL